MGQDLTLKVASAAEIRRLFNEGGFWERARTGELVQVLRRDGHPSPPRANEPYCTRSQIIAYVDRRGQRIAVVHQYLRRDGNLGGGGGKPDPKRLVIGSVLYAVIEPERR